MDTEIEKRLAIRVISRMELTPAEPRQCPQDTMRNIKKALEVLAPFEPSPIVKMMINNFLCAHDATAANCLVTWALYMDFYHIENMKTFGAAQVA